MSSLSTRERHTGRPPPVPDESFAAVPRSSDVSSSVSPGEEESQHTVSPADGTARAQRSVDLPDDLLLDISAAFVNHDQCVSLATALKIIVEREILKLLGEWTFDDRLAYRLMKKWIELRDQQADGPALYAVLHDIGRQDLADQFNERLRGTDLSTNGTVEATAVALGADSDTSGVYGRHGADRKPDKTLLKEIGTAISSHEQCMKLAVKLKISDDHLYKLHEAEFTETLAYEVLTKWIGAEKDEKATGSVLHAALCDADRRDLADRFEERLFGRDGAMSVDMTEEMDTATILFDVDSDMSGTKTSNVVLPSVDLLTDIAAHLPKVKHCVRLAENLALPEEFVKRLREGSLEGAAARGVLFKWKQKGSKRATGKVLFDALIAINKRDVAAGFAEELLGQDDVDWEDFGYDEKYRDFFRLLRRRNVDVFAVYEHARFSDYFIGRLYQRNVLSHPEYDELLESLQAKRDWSAVNKKLMDIVNLKPQQLQELFVDHLLHYQAHLVNVYEELSALSDAPGPREVEVIVPTEIPEEEILADFKEGLIRLFNQLLIVRPVDFLPSEHIQPVNDMYVTLSAISYEEALKLTSGPQQLRGSQLLKAANRVDAESKHSKEIVDLHSLLGSHQGTQAPRALIFGSAGSGKSLTTLKILSEWTSQSCASLFKRFDAVVYITGRERSRLTTDNVSNLWQLQHNGFNKQQECFLLNHFSECSDKVLFLVDGWEEAGEHGLLQEDMVLNKILNGELFPQSAVIITSRPAPTAYHLLEKCKNRYSLTGFNDRRLQELFNRRLSESQATKLFHTLSQSSHVHVKAAIQKTPLFAAMLIELYKFQETLPLTITALYQLILESIRCRYVEWVKETRGGSRSDAMMFDDKSAKVHFDSFVRNLRALAFVGLLNSKVTFTSAEVCSCGEDLVNSRFGLLSEMKEVGEHSDVLYHFSHMTWQEYLGACHLAADPNFINKLRMCISVIGVGEHTHVFWRFVAGLVTSRLLTDLVYELLQASGVSGGAPWETEFSLFLLECVAENIRVRQTLDDLSYMDVNIHVAAALMPIKRKEFYLHGCILDKGHLSSVAVVLRASPCIDQLSVSRCRVDHPCLPLMNALEYVHQVDLDSLSGQESTLFIAEVISSLRQSAITKMLIKDTPLTAECLMTLGQLINDSQSLTELDVNECKLGVAGLACLSSSIVHSSSLHELLLENDSFSGAGGLLAQILSRLPQLKLLHVEACSLNNDDFAGVLVGLRRNPNCQMVHVTRNNLTDEFSAPLLQFAAERNHLREQLQTPLTRCDVQVGGNNISEGMLLDLAFMLPPLSNIFVFDGHNIVSHSHVSEYDHGAQMQANLDASADGQIIYSCPGLRDHGACQVAQILCTNYASHLKTLALIRDNISDYAVSYIAKVLPKTRLQGLDLSDNQLTIAGVHKLLFALSTGCSLHYLNVGQNPIFSAYASSPSELTPSILHLSQSIRSLDILGMSSTNLYDYSSSFENSPLAVLAIPSLCTLDLSNNGITDKSVAMVMEYMSNMQYLSLSGNKISTDGGKQLIAKTEKLLENVDTDKQSACNLQRIWLGGNGIDESVLADCTCKIISGESLSIQNIPPKLVPAMFSPSMIGDSPGRHLLPLTSANIYSPIMIKMKSLVLSREFDQFIERVTADSDSACFDRWFMRSVRAIAYHINSENPVHDAKCLLNLIGWVANWYLKTRAHVPALAVLCCMICVIDEWIITSAMSELEPNAEDTLMIMIRLCRLGSDYLYLMIEYMSSLAERCRRQQLQSVAECLLQQMEYVSQQAWRVMQSP